MQNPFFDHKPDPPEKKIRFGCGFLFGLILGVLGLTRVSYRVLNSYYPAEVIFILAVILAFLCGWLALKYGDRFWL